MRVATGEFRALLKAVIADPTSTHPVFMVERPSGLRDLGIVVRSVSIPDFMHTGSAPPRWRCSSAIPSGRAW